jgi:hypothetical protein
MLDKTYLQSDAKWKSTLSDRLETDFEKNLFDKFYDHARKTPIQELQSPDVVENILQFWDHETIVTVRHMKKSSVWKEVLTSCVIREIIMQVTNDPMHAEVAAKWQNQRMIDNFTLLECLYLIRFEIASRYLAVLLRGRQNKLLFLRVGTILEDSNQKYITGGKSRIETRRRIGIFETLTGVTPRYRTPSEAMVKTTSSPKGKGMGMGMGKGKKRKQDDLDSVSSDSSVSSMGYISQDDSVEICQTKRRKVQTTRKPAKNSCLTVSSSDDSVSIEELDGFEVFPEDFDSVPL